MSLLSVWWLPLAKTDDDLKREIIQQAVAQSVWDLIASLPFELNVMIDRDIVTVDILTEYWKEELEKLIWSG